MNLENIKETQTTKFYKAEVNSYDPNNHTMVFYFTSPYENYRGEKVNPNGVKFAPRLKLMVNHDDSIDPPGGILWVGRTGDRWKCCIEFDQMDPKAVILEHKYARGYKTDVSMGFKTNLKAITEENGVYVHNDILVMEISLVNIGADPEAHILSLEECELITNNVKDEGLKKYFENIKKGILMEKEYKETLDDLVKNMTDSKTDIQKLEERISQLEKREFSIMEEKKEVVDEINIEELINKILFNKK